MNECIFVSITAWREETLEETLKSAINNAKYPDKLRFGIVFEGYEQDSWMLDKIKKYDNVQVMRIDGNTTAPYICNIRGDMALSLSTDETYLLQIDAHTKFVKYWDAFLIEELKMANDFFGKSILTAPTSGFTNWEEPIEPMFGTGCSVDQEWFDTWDMELVTGRTIHRSNLDCQVLERFYHATIVFGYLKDFYACRQPRNISFNLEQPFNTIRFYTAGYNLVSPSKTYLLVYDFNRVEPADKIFNKYHRFDDESQIKRFVDADIASKKRYRDVVNNNIVDPVDGLYSERSLQEFLDFSGYDPIQRKVFKESGLQINPDEINIVDFEKLKLKVGLGKTFNPMILDNFITEEEKKQIMDFIPLINDWQNAGDEFWNDRVIDAKVIYDVYNREVGTLLYIIKQRIEDHIKTFYKLDKPIYADGFQIVRWFPGMEQVPHSDNMEGIDGYGSFFHEREFGSVLYLNDDYSGGHTFYPNFNVDVTPKSKTLVVHPGNIEHTHGVTEVKDNIRYTLASFWTHNEDNDVWSIY